MTSRHQCTNLESIMRTLLFNSIGLFFFFNAFKVIDAVLYLHLIMMVIAYRMIQFLMSRVIESFNVVDTNTMLSSVRP